MKRELILSFIFLIFGLSLSSNVYSLTPDCGNNTIFALYSQTNSHAAAYNGTTALGTQVAICYNDFFSGGNANSQNPWQCSGNANLVLKLSSATNAHAGNSSSGYSHDICYNNLKCEVRASSCVSGETAIASLSSQTNAHISSDVSYYQNKLCCSKITLPSLSAMWTDPISGVELLSTGQNSQVNLTVGALNIANSESITITVYNESNNFILATYSASVINNKAELNKNLSDVLMGNASAGSKIYFNASYSNLNVRSNILNITAPVRGLSNAKWVREGDSAHLPAITVNQTKLIRMYVDTSLISNFENLTFRTYKSNGQFIEEFNISVNNNVAISMPDFIAGFGNNPNKNDEFYFNVTDSISGIEIKSNLIKYLPNDTTRVSTYTCYNKQLTEIQCKESVPTVRTISSTCSNINQLSVCSWQSGTCTEITQSYNETTGEPNTICEATTNNEFTECVNGWKTLLVNVEETEFCGGSGSCSPSDNYKVPCRAVALLPVFTFTNVIVAAGLIAIVYFIIFKTDLFGSRKK